MIQILALTFLVTAATAGTGPIRSGLEIRLVADLESRISNGEVALRTQFPYQVGLSLRYGKKVGWCGGTLISDRWIVTAAHCTKEADSVIVYLGAFNITDNNEAGQQRVFVSKSGIFNHEDYDPKTVANDIAVIKLPSPIFFNKYIKPAVLPKRSSFYSTYVGDSVFASGWGLDGDHTTSTSDILRYINTTVISESSCNFYYLGNISNENICITGEQGRSICNGDSGGPLVYKQQGEYLLIGVASFGSALGCEKGWPGVFTRITSYLDWIDAKTDLVNLFI